MCRARDIATEEFGWSISTPYVWVSDFELCVLDGVRRVNLIEDSPLSG